MPRATLFEVISDTSHFTPLQIQPRAVLSLSFNGLSRWLREHFVSFPELIREYGTSVVIMGAGVTYETPFRFFDGDGFDVRVTLRALRNGTRAQLDAHFNSRKGQIAKARILLCPVRIEDPASLGATPAPFEKSLLQRFGDDETDPSPPSRPLTELKTRIEQSGKYIASGTSEFTVHRHLCEVADQWAFFEVPGLIGASREALVLQHGAEFPELRGALSRPLARIESEFMRPYFWFQAGKIETTAYQWETQMAFVHRLLSPVPGEQIHGFAVECF